MISQLLLVIQMQTPSKKVKNLGVIFDSSMTMEDHVNNVCKTSYYYIRLLGKLQKFLSKEAAAMVTHAFVTSRLDYCNSLFYGISKTLATKLQHVLNCAARIVTRTRISSHVILSTLAGCSTALRVQDGTFNFQSYSMFGSIVLVRTY